jgi:hypothetical protein
MLFDRYVTTFGGTCCYHRHGMNLFYSSQSFGRVKITSILKMEAAGYVQTTRYHILEDRNLHFYCSGNLRFHKWENVLISECVLVFLYTPLTLYHAQ